MQPKDETNHIFYTTWRDRGGNIGVQCTFRHADGYEPTFWNGKERMGKILQDEKNPHSPLIDCFNCQAIVKTNVLQLENDHHKAEPEGSACPHKPSQPE
jgi:hypothetical protein